MRKVVSKFPKWREGSFWPLYHSSQRNVLNRFKMRLHFPCGLLSREGSSVPLQVAPITCGSGSDGRRSLLGPMPHFRSEDSPMDCVCVCVCVISSWRCCLFLIFQCQESHTLISLTTFCIYITTHNTFCHVFTLHILSCGFISLLLQMFPLKHFRGFPT